MRRLIDISFSLAALAILSPVIALLAVSIVIDSPGNPFYGGRRIGRDGRPFRMWKLRTMVRNADKTGPSITGKGDARVTRLGELLRRSKLDELPQFFNVLMGEMTLVGPRAEAPDIVARYTAEQRELLRFKPGITGVGAIHFTNEQQAEVPNDRSADDYYVKNLLADKLALEASYEASRTAFSDIRLIVQTAGMVLTAPWRTRGLS